MHNLHHDGHIQMPVYVCMKMRTMYLCNTTLPLTLFNLLDCFLFSSVLFYSFKLKEISGAIPWLDIMTNQWIVIYNLKN